MRNPEFETVCSEMWGSALGMTPEQWAQAGTNVKDAISATLIDSVVREKFDAQIAKLLANRETEWWFYPENLAVDVYTALPKTHWIKVEGIKCFNLHYPEGM